MAPAALRHWRPDGLTHARHFLPRSALWACCSTAARGQSDKAAECPAEHRRRLGHRAEGLADKTGASGRGGIVGRHPQAQIVAAAILGIKGEDITGCAVL